MQCPSAQIKALALWTRSWWSLQPHSSCGDIQIGLKEANAFCLNNITFEIECWGAMEVDGVYNLMDKVGFQAW